MRALLLALVLAAGCTERVNLEPGHGGGGALGGGGHSGGSGGDAVPGSGGAGGQVGYPCPSGGPCSHEGAVCSDNSCTTGPSGTTMARCMCVKDNYDLSWACSRVWCSDAGTVRSCPADGDVCQPDWVLADCCANGQVRYCLCPGTGPGAFTWQCRTIDASCSQ